jgi:tetratricopeptide (TPR) repeat protein/photosystem II stability/assembly factor-like uncharacterized protein
MTDQPDFIVDPSGGVKDVRHQKYWRTSASPAPQKPEAGSSGRGGGVPTHSQYIQKPKRPPGVIVIPIGLIIAIMVAVCRLLSGSTANDSYSDSDISFLNSGIGHYSRGDYDMAIVYFNMVISSEPDFGEAYNNRGLAYHAKGDNDSALADFEKAIELLPDSAIPYSNRGAVYLSMGDYENAIADLDKALELDPTFSKAYYNRGLTYLGLGDYDNAIADFDKAIEFTPEEVSTILNKVPTGESPLSAGLMDYFQYTQSYADLPSAYAYRGIAHFGKGDLDRAIADLEKASELGLDPNVERQVRALLTTRVFAPEPGHWEGEFFGGVYSAPISFDIGTDGNIHDLEFAMNFGSDSCVVTSDEIVIEADGSFSFAFGSSSSQDANVIRGRFESSTTVIGSTSDLIECIGQSGDSISVSVSSAEEDTWRAELIDEQVSVVPTESSIGTSTALIDGKARALAIDPLTPTTLYVGIEGRGVFKSTNAGRSWNAINTGITYSSVYVLAIDPASPNTIYAGTWGEGVFKSTDGGQNWEPTDLVNTDISALAIDPDRPTTVYAGTKSSSVFKSTDGGDNWNTINMGFTTNLSALVIDPRTPTTLYAGSDEGVFKSTNGGSQWHKLNTGPTIALAIDPLTPATLYAGTRSATYTGSWRYYPGSVFKSTDGGDNWDQVIFRYTWFWTLAIDPLTPTTLYAGSDEGVLKSTDSGRSWTEVGSGLAEHAVYALAIDPLTPTTLYAGTGDGVFKSMDGGGNWRAINTGLTE